jgi:hypothetical protein
LLSRFGVVRVERVMLIRATNTIGQFALKFFG